MRCPDCNKFVSFEDGEPEVESIDVDDAGGVTASVRVVDTCAECSTELREYTFELEGEPAFEDGKDHDEHGGMEIEHDDPERTERMSGDAKTPFRYRKRFIGVIVHYTVTCECGATYEGDLADDVQASSMEELV